MLTTAYDTRSQPQPPRGHQRDWPGIGRQGDRTARQRSRQSTVNLALVDIVIASNRPFWYLTRFYYPTLNWQVPNVVIDARVREIIEPMKHLRECLYLIMDDHLPITQARSFLPLASKTWRADDA